MKYIGIDYGTKRIGVARSDESGTLAFPLTTIAAGPNALALVAALANKESAHKIIIGESRDFKNEPNVVQEDIEQFKSDLAELTGLPVEYQNELFSSAQAARQFAPEEKSRKENPSQAQLDASAAALILQSYLDSKK
jgi:putative holliday junction resolvase